MRFLRTLEPRLPKAFWNLLVGRSNAAAAAMRSESSAILRRRRLASGCCGGLLVEVHRSRGLGRIESVEAAPREAKETVCASHGSHRLRKNTAGKNRASGSDTLAIHAAARQSRLLADIATRKYSCAVQGIPIAALCCCARKIPASHADDAPTKHPLSQLL